MYTILVVSFSSTYLLLLGSLYKHEKVQIKTEIFHKLREDLLFVVVGKDPAHHPRSDRYEFLCVCTASTFETASLRVC